MPASPIPPQSTSQHSVRHLSASASGLKNLQSRAIKTITWLLFRQRPLRLKGPVQVDSSMTRRSDPSTEMVAELWNQLPAEIIDSIKPKSLPLTQAEIIRNIRFKPDYQDCARHLRYLSELNLEPEIYAQHVAALFSSPVPQQTLKKIAVDLTLLKPHEITTLLTFFKNQASTTVDGIKLKLKVTLKTLFDMVKQDETIPVAEFLTSNLCHEKLLALSFEASIFSPDTWDQYISNTKFKSLKKISLTQCVMHKTAQTAPAPEHLCSSVKELEIRNTCDSRAYLLLCFPAAERITLSASNVEMAHLKALQKNKNLKQLDFEFSSASDPARPPALHTWMSLSMMATLRSIAARGCVINQGAFDPDLRLSPSSASPSLPPG
ncbi:hypothetical protein QS306_14285 [Paraburkholderia bonniea]|uniref:hypothetical protein n=1 Tax=Paraburkholderia bonniea TaxID=2152891 RepID=UPI00129158C1|nr:hypothetical protein [Paraburkholderia bonniea]WJF91939.1 hypothetical protein QS306_14285 [Paraburkholderia bonniea]WJF95258.1 hypothetical protein QS308_14290 [Paraburkholderia bonniea]